MDEMDVTFNECLNKVVEKAQKNGNMIKEEDIPILFEEVDLTPEVFEKIMNILDQKEILCVSNDENLEDVSIEDIVDIADFGKMEDSISLYFKEISEYKLLSAEEEIELAKRIEMGDEIARKEFIEANLRLVVFVAKRYRGLGMSFQDIISEGTLGLMKAVNKFDYNRGKRFSTYAIPWIKQSIARAIPRQGRAIRLPEKVATQLYKMNKTTEMFLKKYGRQPRPEEIAKELELNEEKVKELLLVSQQPVSLEMTVGDEDSCLEEFIKADKLITPESIVSNMCFNGKLDVMLEDLNESQEKIIRMRFGCVGGHPMTLEEIATSLKMPVEMVRLEESIALEKLNINKGV